MDDKPKFETWAIVEVMGHSRYAGFVSEQAVGGCSFVRVDVPEIPAEKDRDGRQAFTKLLGQSSIFCLTPCTEETARAAAKSFRCLPLTMFDVSSSRPQISRHDQDDDEFDDGHEAFDNDPNGDSIIDYLDQTRASDG